MWKFRLSEQAEAGATSVLRAPPAVEQTALRQLPAYTGRARLRPRDYPLHPFLFGASSVLGLYAANFREMDIADTFVALAAVTAFAFLLLISFGVALRSFGPRAAILTSTVVIAALYYSDLTHWVNGNLGGIILADARLPVTFGTTIVLLAVLSWLRFSMTLPNIVLNAIAALMFAVQAWNIAVHEAHAISPYPPGEADEFSRAGGPGGALAAAAGMPDIYYFIFDRYGSESTLLRRYGFDNREFISFLKESGFYVASLSHSNYLKTAPSLASTFHMDYLDFLQADERTKRNDWHPIYEMIDGHHRVARFLKGHGYEFINIGGWWGPTQENSLADENYSFGLPEFDWLYLRRTVVPSILQAVAPDSLMARRTDWDNGQCHRVPRQFEKVKTIAERPETTFTFSHILLPHEPYVFDENGKCLPFAAVDKRGQITGYVGQVKYANALIKDLVTDLLARPGQKPIIILQADEGPFPERYRTSNRSWRIADKDELQMKTAILNAYYFPDGDYADLGPDITPVNSFRVVFDKFFGAKFGRLPDRVFAHTDYSKIYDFFDVTEIVSGEPE